MSHNFPEIDKQNFFFLSVIQMASAGVPTLSIGYLLSKQYGPGVAIPSIIIGNFILWLVGISVISIAGKRHINGIQNIGNFLGIFGSMLISIILVVDFLDWYTVQINSTIYSLKEALPLTLFSQKGGVVRIGVTLGLASSLFAIGGIRLLKWISVICFPFLFTYVIYVYLQFNGSLLPLSWGLSLPAILVTIFSLLAGVLGLPTFFRHSISMPHSYLALTTLTIFFIIFQCSGVLIHFDAETYGIIFSRKTGESWIYEAIFTVVVIFSYLCTNLFNIYLASACYETFCPRFYGTKGHAIVGLLGTATYAFLQVPSTFRYILEVLNSYLLNLGIVLLIAYLIRAMMKYKSNALEKWTNCTAWMVGCIAATIAKCSNPEDTMEFLFVGASASTLFFLVFIFLEETGSAIRTLYMQRVRK